MNARREKQLAILVLGLCPAMVVSTRVIDALFMSVGVLLVLSAVSMILPVVRRADRRGRPGDVSPAGRTDILWGALLLASCLTGAFELALNALAPAEASRLGIYVPLIAVNLAVTGRVEDLARSPSVRSAALDALRHGAAFTVILVVVALVREVLGAGTLTVAGAHVVRPFFNNPARALGMAGGGLLCLGYAAGAARLLGGRRAVARDGSR